MARDIKIHKEDGSFKVRVYGVLEQDGKFLTSKTDGLEFYSFPAGHVKIGENTEIAAEREFFEETQIKAKPEKLIAIVQLFFDRGDGKALHEMGFFYNMKPLKKIECKNFNLQEINDGEIKNYNFEWKTKEELKQLDIRPSIVIDCLGKGLTNQMLFSYRDGMDKILNK